MRRRGRSVVVGVAMMLVATGCFSPSDPGALTVYGPYVGAEADVFAEVLARFEADTGIDTVYVGTSNFQGDFTQRVNARELSDVTILPQLALIEPLLDEDLVRSLTPEASTALLEKVGPVWGSLIAPAGVAFAVPYRFVVKSIVWYRADSFSERGYEPPQTLAELDSLVARMVNDGLIPWCSGMDSGSSTGWWATDWVEDLMVRQVGETDYWQWAGLQVPFTSDAVMNAMSTFQEIIDADGAFLGGPRTVLTTRVEDAISPMFDRNPGCMMHKQASFQPVWFPSGVDFSSDKVDIFPLPGVEPGPPPMLISGEIAVATSDNPAAQQLLEFLLTPEGFGPWLERGGSLVATADPNDVPTTNELDRRLADMVASAPTVVLDASDLMPQQVGSEAFFQGMVELIAGSSPAEVAARIQSVADALDDG